MIQTQTKLNVADNTGAKVVQCIGILGKGRGRIAGVGDLVSLVVKVASPRGQVKKGEIVRGLVVRTKFPLKREDGTVVRFDDNAVVLIAPDKTLKGTRIFGPVARELKDGGFSKIISKAKEII